MRKSNRSFCFYSVILKTVLLLLCFFSINAFSQTISSSPNSFIPDNMTIGKVFPMSVSLMATQLDSTYGLKRVMIDIQHSRVQDLTVSLIAPDGTSIELTTAAGGVLGQNYDSTCFAMNASRSTLMSQAPFRDTFYPRQNIGFMNNGQNSNGIWRLVVIDALPGDSGTLRGWSLFFDSVAPAPKLVQNNVCNLFNANGCVCTDSSKTSDCWLFPDMIISKNWFTDSALGLSHYEEYPQTFNVSNMLANIGEGPLEFVGTGQWYCGDSLVSGNQRCPDSTFAKQKLKQRIYIKNRFGFFDYQDTVVGFMGYHAENGHKHLHVDNITQNTLRIRGPEADPTLWPIIASGNKVSINMYDHISCNSFDACEWNGNLIRTAQLPNAGLGAQYGATNLSIQGVSVGFADLYEYNLPGQNIPLDTTVCNGDYMLVGQYDPKQAFLDKSRSNDIVYGKVTLTQQKPNCCKASFQIDTLDLTSQRFQFIDRSTAMPQSWLWEFGDGDTSHFQFPVHAFSTSGTKIVHLKTTTAQGCVAESWATLSVVSGIQDVALKGFYFSLYPNPSKGQFNLEVEGSPPRSLALFDMQGRKVWQTDAPSQQTKFSISVKDSGVYLLEVKIAEATKFLKLIKE